MTHGSALVSIQHITGEALPVSKRVGDEVPAGAVNSDGALVVKTLRGAEDSTPARIARLTEAAQNRRPAVSRLLDTFGDRYSKAILGVTLATMILGPLVFGMPFLGRSGAMYRAFAFLSAAAPCALLMSPLVYIAAIGACARRGVLVRGGLTLDALAECGTVALDKTGTITTGQMACASVERVEKVAPALVTSSGDFSDVAADARVAVTRAVTRAVSEPPSSSPAALAIAANLERGATHPIARAVLDAAARAADDGTSLPEVAVTEFKVVHGSGVEGLVSPARAADAAAFGPPRRARFGNPEWASEIAGDVSRTSAVVALARTRSGDGDITAALVVASGSGSSGKKTGPSRETAATRSRPRRRRGPRKTSRACSASQTRCTRKPRRRSRRFAPGRGAWTARLCA